MTPQVCHQFETQLHAQLRELGRIIVAWTFNHIEPRDRRDMPNQMYFQGVWYRRRSKTPKCTVATLFGTITLCAIPSTAPRRRTVDLSLGVRLGLEVGLATPALTERVGQAAVTSSQNSVLEYLKRNHGVSWSVATFGGSHRLPVGGVWDASTATTPRWLRGSEVAGAGVASRGLPQAGAGRWVVTGRCCRSVARRVIGKERRRPRLVHDRKVRRFGDGVPCRMPEPGQETLFLASRRQP